MPENRARSLVMPFSYALPSRDSFFSWVVAAIKLRRTFCIQVNPLDARWHCFNAMATMLSAAAGFASLDTSEKNAPYTRWLQRMRNLAKPQDGDFDRIITVLTELQGITESDERFLLCTVNDRDATFKINRLEPPLRDLVEAVADAFCNAYDSGHCRTISTL